VRARSFLSPALLRDVGPALALAAAIAGADAVAAGHVLIGLLVAPPLLVAARRGPWQTAGTLAVCLVLAVVAGVWDHIFLDADHLLRVLVVAVGGSLAIWIAAIRARAERDRTYALFLAQASVILEEAPRPDVLLRRLATLAVPRLGDWCAIHLVAADGTIHDVIVVHSDPDAAQALRAGWAQRIAPDSGPGRVVRTGEAELLEDVRRELQAGSPRDSQALQALHELRVRSSVCVPLRARGRTLAAMTLGSTLSRRRFRQTDLARAMDLAAIAAGSLDNLRLIEETEQARAELERAHERTSFLSQAGALLESSLDVEQTLGDVANLLVPRFAEVCTIYVVGADGEIRRLGAVAADPAMKEALSELVASYTVDPDSAHPAARVLRTGRMELIDVGEEILEPIAKDARHLELMRRAVGRTALLLPLRAHGRTTGVLSLRWLEPHHHVPLDDVALLEELCARIALAADNARIYAERDAVARTLAQSLVPSELPEVPGFELGAKYLPATREAGVGGDFYDVFAMRDGRWMLLVGDVCGKGAPAASLTALARHTMRTAAMTTARPARMLHVLNESMLHASTHGRFCTVACAVLEARTGRGGRVTVACGGHPAPVVLRSDGTIDVVPAVGTIIGAFEEASVQEAKVDLHPGDAFVLFTDGVTEAGTASDLLGDAGLHELVLSCREMTAADMAECIAERAVELQHGEPRDDIAIVALRTLPSG
jgi:serine phosphatase RsbU (regulator of sigma subunit)